MFLSIIIPTFNRYHDLAVCLNSIAKQITDTPGVEVIVIDDYSEESTSKSNQNLCEEFHFTYIRHDKNCGSACSRNTGINHSNGKWVAFLDDDIRIHDYWVSNIFSALPSLPDTVIGIEGYVEGSGDGLWDREVQNLTGHAYLTCNYLVRRSALIQTGGFDTNFGGPFCEDHELTVRLLKLGTIIFNKNIAVTHLPRQINFVKHVRKSFWRMKMLLRSEFHFFSKHPDKYYLFRHCTTFQGTYHSILIRHFINSFRRRNCLAILKHPLQAVVLLVSGLIEQISAWILLPEMTRLRQNRSKSSKKVKIWIAASIPENSAGGINRSMIMIGEGLKKSAYDVELLYNKRNGSYITFALHLAFRLLISFNKPQWIIARSTDGVFCALLSKLPGFKTRVVLHNHGWEEKALELEKSLPSNLITNPTTWKSTIIRFPLLRLNLSLVTYCMSGTVEESRWIASRYRKEKNKIAVIPNGITVDSKSFWSGKDAFPPDFLMVGGCTWKKNIEYGISVFNAVKTKIPEASLHIIGTRKSALEMGTSLPDNGSIHFYEKVDPDKMGDYYERCPFLLFTSRYEGGHAFTILEAQAKGMVAFVTSIPSTSEIVSDQKNGCFISGNNPAEDATLIEQVCTDPARIKRIGSAAFKNASRHRIDRQIQRLETLLSKEK